MTYRKVRNPHPIPEGVHPWTREEILDLAMECFAWPMQKVKSWYMLENNQLMKSRPQELVDRGQAHLVVDFLEKRRQDRLNNERREQEKRDAKRNA